MNQREYLKSTQRAIREKETNQTSSYRRSLKYFVLLFLGCKTHQIGKYPTHPCTPLATDHIIPICFRTFTRIQSFCFFGTPYTIITTVTFHTKNLHEQFYSLESGLGLQVFLSLSHRDQTNHKMRLPQVSFPKTKLITFSLLTSYVTI